MLGGIGCAFDKVVPLLLVVAVAAAAAVPLLDDGSVGVVMPLLKVDFGGGGGGGVLLDDAAVATAGGGEEDEDVAAFDGDGATRAVAVPRAFTAAAAVDAGAAMVCSLSVLEAPSTVCTDPYTFAMLPVRLIPKLF